MGNLKIALRTIDVIYDDFVNLQMITGAIPASYGAYFRGAH